MKVTVLGSGGSGGVPLPDGTPGGAWVDCDPAEPRNRRRRVAIAIETGGRTLLVDAGPDIREQLLTFEVPPVDAVLLTHWHADHCHGLDDLRAMAYRRKGQIPAYMSAETWRCLAERFDYMFKGSAPRHQQYPTILEERVFDYGDFAVEGVPCRAFRQDHRGVESAGFRFGSFAYSTDAWKLDEAAFAALEGVETWIVDCLAMHPHPTHSWFEQTMAWIERVRPKRAYLTHLNHTMDYRTLLGLCPEGVEPAWDGLVLELPE